MNSLEPPNTTHRALATFCLAISIATASVASIGVFFRGADHTAEAVSVRGERYPMVVDGIYAFNAERIVAEGIGWDIFTLVVAIPALLVTLPSVARGSLRARLLALGLLAYFFYQYLMYALTWAFGPLFVPHIAIYTACLAAIAWLVSTIAVRELPAQFGARFPRRGIAILCCVLGITLVGMWATRIAAGLRGDLTRAMLLGQTTMVVQALDLGLIVPLALFTGLLVWRRRPLGYLLSSIFVIKTVAMAGAICAMLLSAWVTEERLDVGGLAFFAASAAVATWLAARIYTSVPSKE